MLRRTIYQELKKWKASPHRKPLILKGARQVGKTSIIKHFAKQEYADFIYLNFDEDQELAGLFNGSLSADKLLEQIALYLDRPKISPDCLIIFDEIQECPRALNSLKYFCEDRPEFHIISAGSLLGVHLAKTKGFPVGKVNFLELFPLNYFEFIEALSGPNLSHHLETISLKDPTNEAIHKKCSDYLKLYLYIGGMPEAVQTYVDTQDLSLISNIHKSIIEGFILDFSKHADRNIVMKLTEVWQSIPSQLSKENKKFIFSLIRESARAREYDIAIEWLRNAGLIYKSYQCNTSKLPLNAYSNRQIYKVYLLDVGLLGYMNKVSPKMTLSEEQLITEFKGALTENYVMQELMQQYQSELYYWTSNGRAEVDLIMTDEDKIYPLEIKSGLTKKKRSLLVYAEKYPDQTLGRTSPRNLKKDGNLINYPLYLISRFPKLNCNASDVSG